MGKAAAYASLHKNGILRENIQNYFITKDLAIQYLIKVTGVKFFFIEQIIPQNYGFFKRTQKSAPDNLFGCRGRLCYRYSWLATMPHLKWTSMPSSPTMICSTSCFMIMLSSASMIAPFFRNGADPNRERILKDGSRYSPLIDSIHARPNTEIPKMLIEAGADVNYRSINGALEVPVLSYAICAGNVGIVERLLSKGADPCCEIVFNDGSRSSVLRDCILRWPNAQIIDLLCSYMNPLPDDVRGLKVKRSGLSEQTIKKLKAAGCKVKMF